MSILHRFDVVPGPHQTLAFDDGQRDTETYRDENGVIQQRSIAVTPAEAHEVELNSMRRALASVDHRLSLDPTEHFAWELPPSTEQVELKRAGLEAEREHILAELERLEATTSEPPKRRRR